jgi:hypothetical protein
LTSPECLYLVKIVAGGYFTYEDNLKKFKNLCDTKGMCGNFVYLPALGVSISSGIQYSLSDSAVIGMLILFLACSLLFLSMLRSLLFLFHVLVCSLLFLRMLRSLLFLACPGKLTAVPCMLTAVPGMLHFCSLACSLLFLACLLLTAVLTFLLLFWHVQSLFTAVPSVIIHVAGMFRHAHYCSWYVHCFCKSTGK